MSNERKAVEEETIKEYCLDGVVELEVAYVNMKEMLTPKLELEISVKSSQQGCYSLKLDFSDKQINFLRNFLNKCEAAKQKKYGSV